MQNIVFPCTFDYNTSKRIIEDLIKEYPFLKAEIFSRSNLGKGIFSLSLGNEKNSALYVGSIHGCEWLTCLVLLLFCQRLCRCIKENRLLSSVNIRKAFSQTGLTIVPCLNPDGAEISQQGAKSSKHFLSSFSQKELSLWKANAMGVDINCNFPYHWQSAKNFRQEMGIFCPAPAFFGGDFPESESETRALTRLCRKKRFRQCLTLHTSGKEIFWQKGENSPPQSTMMAKILSSCCNYTLKIDEGVSSFGSLEKWFTDEFFRPAFKMKIGKGQNPLPINELYSVYAEIEEALTVFALM